MSALEPSNKKMSALYFKNCLHYAHIITVTGKQHALLLHLNKIQNCTNKILSCLKNKSFERNVKLISSYANQVFRYLRRVRMITIENFISVWTDEYSLYI